jgi:hypothetical protein
MAAVVSMKQHQELTESLDLTMTLADVQPNRAIDAGERRMSGSSGTTARSCNENARK